MMFATKKLVVTIGCVLLLSCVSYSAAFATTTTVTSIQQPQRRRQQQQQQQVIGQQQQQQQQQQLSFVGSTKSSTTTLHERRWNFNDGQGPFGLKKNAEIWNGRVAQMAFVLVLLQELIQGKGVIDGIAEGDPVNIALAGAFFVTIIGFTGFLAFKANDSDYVDKDLGLK